MTDESQGSSPKTKPVEAKEDADTAAARKELKHTVISEEQKASESSAPTASQVSRATPPAELDDTGDEDLKDKVASAKKKRVRDQDDEGQEVDDGDARSVASSDSAKDRASRLGPEKKRHRDEAALEATDSAETPAVRPLAGDAQKPSS